MGFMADQKARNEAGKALKAGRDVESTPATAGVIRRDEKLTELKATHDAQVAAMLAAKTKRQDTRDAAHRAKRERKEARRAVR